MKKKKKIVRSFLFSPTFFFSLFSCLAFCLEKTPLSWLNERAPLIDLNFQSNPNEALSNLFFFFPSPFPSLFLFKKKKKKKQCKEKFGFFFFFLIQKMSVKIKAVINDTIQMPNLFRFLPLIFILPVSQLQKFFLLLL